MNSYKHFFGFQKEPFAQDISIKELYPLPATQGLLERFNYVVGLRAVGVITGEIGSGKSTSLRLATHGLHPSEFKLLTTVAHTGTLKEVLKQILFAFDAEAQTGSITSLLKTTQILVQELAARKQTPLLLIDEAHLLRSEVFAHLHTVIQFDFDSKPLMPIIFCGQNQLVDKLSLLSCRALASRVVGRTHLESLKLAEMAGYIKHHMEIAGIPQQPFSEEAIMAIHQGAGGLLRRANILARGALMAAAKADSRTVAPEHVRIASTEII